MQLSWLKHRTGTPPTWVQWFDSPVRQGIFLLELTFSADSLTVSVYSFAHSHAFTSVRALKVL